MNQSQLLRLKNQLPFVACWLLAMNLFAITPWTLSINTNNIFPVTSFGAVGDGVTTNTTAIQNAINAATLGGTTNGLRGGTVEIPPGVFMCGPITLVYCPENG